MAGDESAVGKRVGKDAERGKLTYPELLGVEPSRAFADELASQACQALVPFGEQGEPLAKLTQSVAQRNH